MHVGTGCLEGLGEGGREWEGVGEVHREAWEKPSITPPARCGGSHPDSEGYIPQTWTSSNG